MSNKILIIDDDMKLRNLLREYLEGYNHDVLTLGDSLQASQTVRSESPDMVILDIMMPHKDGLEVLREIRAVSRVPVIMLTAKGEDADRIVGLELGADDYLPKPFNPRELLARMKAVWRRIDRSVSASLLKASWLPPSFSTPALSSEAPEAFTSVSKSSSRKGFGGTPSRRASFLGS